MEFGKDPREKFARASSRELISATPEVRLFARNRE